MKRFLVLFATATMLFSCQKDKEKDGYFKSEEVQFHHGKAWSWIKVSKNGAPDQLGISINNAAMNSLPTTVDGNHQGGGHNHQNSLVVPMHSEALRLTPFKFIGMDWNPGGHPPENVYTLPHFDFHYYMVTPAEVDAVNFGPQMDNHPAADYLPATYFPGPPAPKMGKHWLDSNAPELSQTNPQTFTETFIYGTYNGKVTFYEPMITKTFLENNNNFERAIPQPDKVQTTGYYPTRMKIKKEGNTTEVILQSFVYRTAS